MAPIAVFFTSTVAPATGCPVSALTTCPAISRCWAQTSAEEASRKTDVASKALRIDTVTPGG
jgi:hypothetical protein